MTRSRSLFAGAFLLGAFVAGCLFPSLDDLKKSNQASAPTDASTATPTGSSSIAKPIDGAIPVDSTGKVQCRSKTCNVASQYCCANMLLDFEDDCRASSDDQVTLCANEAAGEARAMHCDGPEDCPGTEQCCFADNPDIGAVCASTTCLGQILCHDSTTCPTGKTCTAAALFKEYSVCQ